MISVFYIANIRMPTERAHGIQVAHMCAAFSKQGVEVTLLVPDRKTVEGDPFEYYGVERNFRIEKVPVPDTVRFWKIGFLLESVVFAWRAAKRVTQGAVVYTREELPILFAPHGIPVFYEAHNLRNSVFFRLLIKQATGVVAISDGIANAIAALPFPKQKILVAHDGYDNNTNLRTEDTKVRKEEVRRRLGLPEDGKLAMYIGGFEKWKGVPTLLSASDELLKNGIRVAIIGGSERELSELRGKYPQVFFLGTRPYRDLAVNQQAADVLVIPNSAVERISREFTSPLKLFAHMASGVPIVASDIPSLREVLTEESCFFFEPDSTESLSTAIVEALSTAKSPPAGGLAVEKAQQAKEQAKEYTWKKRAGKILLFISGFSP